MNWRFETENTSIFFPTTFPANAQAHVNSLWRNLLTSDQLLSQLVIGLISPLLERWLAENLIGTGFSGFTS